MSNKLGFMLSLIFLVHTVLFSLDLIVYQTAYSKLEMVASNARSMIYQDRGFERAKTYVDSLEGELICLEKCGSLTKGDFVVFSVSIKYQPVFIAKNVESRAIVTKKSVIV